MSHVRALVLPSGFIGLVGLASAFDLPRVRGIVEQPADACTSTGALVANVRGRPPDVYDRCSVRG